ncbi:hypothetical protein UFOVP222_91 [uncultured Caudovirales phage]|uniref:Uncharacterized protein n=1 Tax=uncultured Caudovirales phage TaxID=2100421 RepID=A0A6J5TBB7_9CAUD|nr:hypothetical protein UFOVP108_86 [uncultured Caudovirales phage]CAB5219573.1 hypothetical protein UFOVP222_91 [uncultured Caudovirales phage]
METWWSVTTDPNHIIAELIFNLVFDGLIIALGYGIIIKKVIMPYLRKNIHKYIDTKHNVIHEEY